mmetsp:Transcript_44562/g.140352  ORF Transcript_44562/g.140352 Transcript_44562/m.140352 type:complete len:289 (+) Transcript_44562:1-867(+)
MRSTPQTINNQRKGVAPIRSNATQGSAGPSHTALARVAHAHSTSVRRAPRVTRRTRWKTERAQKTAALLASGRSAVTCPPSPLLSSNSPPPYSSGRLRKSTSESDLYAVSHSTSSTWNCSKWSPPSYLLYCADVQKALRGRAPPSAASPRRNAATSGRNSQPVSRSGSGGSSPASDGAPSAETEKWTTLVVASLKPAISGSLTAERSSCSQRAITRASSDGVKTPSKRAQGGASGRAALRTGDLRGGSSGLGRRGRRRGTSMSPSESSPRQPAASLSPEQREHARASA